MTRWLSSIVLALAVCGEVLADEQQANIPVQAVGELLAIRGGEQRLGANNRMFLIEDQWEFDRCKLILPTLPAIDFQKESFLVIISWKSRARSLQAVESEGNTLVVRVTEQKPPQMLTGMYRPPDFLVFKLPAWKGPVQFEINGHEQFTILRGEALEKRCFELWEEVLRIHSGGDATLPQIKEYFQRRAPDMPEKEIWKIHSNDPKRFRSQIRESLDDTLFRELMDIRAKAALPKIFALIESMGKHDKSFNLAWKSVVGIGGPEVIEHCKGALSSWNARSRHAAMLILRDLALPETRPLVHAHLVDIQYQPVGRVAMGALHHLGVTSDDLPAMIQALEEVEAFFLTPLDERPDIGHSDDLGHETMVGIGSLGSEGQDALPILERFGANPTFPVVARKNAREAIARIKGESETP